MKNKLLVYNLMLIVLGLIFIMSCETRDKEDLSPVSFPTTGEVFLDNFTGDLQYAAFGDSDVTAFDIETEETFDGSTQAMRFAIPPDGSYAGGIFFSTSGRDLSGYNALTFYVRATQPATIAMLGFGNSFGENKYITEVFNTPVNTNWQKVIIPIPNAAKLIGEKGLLSYADNSTADGEGGKGYTLWIDEVKFENLSDLGEVTGTILDGQGQVIDNARNGDTFDIRANGGFKINAVLPNGQVSQDINTTPYYFNFTSSDPDVATVDDLGNVTVLSAGTTTITADLGSNSVVGSLELTSLGDPLPVIPTVAAPTPTISESNVLSVYSDEYTTNVVPGVNLVPNWGQNPPVVVTTDVEIGGNNTMHYSNFSFQGIEFSSNFDVSSYGYLHLDYYSTNASELEVYLISGGPFPDVVEKGIPLSVPTEDGWNSIDIPLSSFDPVVLNDIHQMKFDSGSGADDIYLDNIYFFNVPATPTEAAPTPTYPAGDVLSVYSDEYTDIAGVNLAPNWGQNPVVNYPVIDGNNTLNYAGFTFQGIEFAANFDVSSYGFLHLDFYSANATTLEVYLISGGPFPDVVEKGIPLSVPTVSGWNSIDIPLSSFAPVVLSDIHQMKFDALGTGPSDIYLDNILFRK